MANVIVLEYMFGTQMSWPGMGPHGNFTNGSFTDPEVKPSMIPAETINLLIDNIAELIGKLGGMPANSGTLQLADRFTAEALSRRAMMRDVNGSAKIAARPANVNADPDDLVRQGDLDEVHEELTQRMNAREGLGGPLPHTISARKRRDRTSSPNTPVSRSGVPAGRSSGANPTAVHRPTR
jgi:hypothetical protein